MHYGGIGPDWSPEPFVGEGFAGMGF